MADLGEQVVHTDGGELVFTCPRCTRPARQRFYGPCATCYEELGAAMGSVPQGRTAERAAYEPKMNVTPNFVATKD